MIRFIGLSLTLVLISGFGQQATETPEQMADRLLGAIGGRARWAAVTNTVNDSQQNLVADPAVLRVVITMDFARPRFRIDTTGPNLKVVRVIDGPRSWMLTRTGAIQDVPDDIMKTDMQWYAGHVYRTLHRVAARDAALTLSINTQRRLEIHENGARILWLGLDARGEPYAFGAHANDAGTASGPWEFVHEGIHHPLWVSSPDGTWRAMIKTLAVNVPLTNEMFARPSQDQQPPPGPGHSLVYHAGLKRVVLFDTGLVPSATGVVVERPSRLWSWDGAAWTPLGEPGPAPRQLAGVAYDAARDVIVVYGGTKGDRKTYYNDTWEWSATTGWRRIDTAGPGFRHHTRMTYHARRRESVLFGGANERDEFPADVWTWNGSAWQRHQGQGPVGRVHHALEFDGTDVMLAGGVTQAGKVGDVWTWRDGAWTRVTPDGPPGSHAVLVRETARRRMVMVGEVLGSIAAEWTADGWRALTAERGPQPRFMPGAAFDEQREVLVIYGGGPQRAGATTGDTWELGASGWTQRR